MRPEQEKLRERVVNALLEDIEWFWPWGEIISSVHGNYSSESDRLMIAALEAVRDQTTFEFIKKEGFAAELMLYILSGSELTEYGTSPRGAWPDEAVAHLWPQIIEKWKQYAAHHWGENWKDDSNEHPA